MLNQYLNTVSRCENWMFVCKDHNQQKALGSMLTKWRVSLSVIIFVDRVKLREGSLTTLFQADPIIFHSPPRRQRGPGSQAWGGQGRPPTCRGRQRGSAHDTRPEQETDTCDGDQDHGGRWTLPILPWCCDTVASARAGTPGALQIFTAAAQLETIASCVDTLETLETHWSVVMRHLGLGSLSV